MEHEIKNIIQDTTKKANIIFESTYDSIRNFIDNNNDTEKLVELCTYIGGSKSLNSPPTKMQKLFIEEFFANDAWAKFLQQRKNTDRFSQYIPSFNFEQINGILNFEVMRLVNLKISTLNLKLANNKVKETSLKYDLLGAIDNSYFDGVFDKYDGFSNIYEVLIKHKFLKEIEE